MSNEEACTGVMVDLSQRAARAGIGRVRRPFYFEIFWATLAAILLEIAYTRIFSFKVSYSFTYLVVGTGLLGLGAGGALVAAARRLAEGDRERLIPRLCLLGAASVLVGYLATARVQLNASALDSERVEIAKLVGICVALALPLVAIGAIVALILSAASERPGRVYAADLAGAAMGSALSIFLLGFFDAPRVIMLAGGFLAVAAVPLAKKRRLELIICCVLGSALLLSGTVVRWLPDPVVDRGKRFEEYREQGQVRTTRYDPVFRVDVTESPLARGDLFLLMYDGAPGSVMRRFPSRAFDHLDNSARKLPFTIMPHLGPRVLILGAGGGEEVVAALHFGASHVTAVELNAATLELVTQTYADVTGNLKANPRVTFVKGDGRWFLQQTRQAFDLIWLVGRDPNAAMNAATSAPFVFGDSYLYTVEMVEQAFHHLAPDGILCAQFTEPDFDRKPNRTVRFLAGAKHFYYEEGIPDFKKRVMVATSEAIPPFVESTLVLSPAPFSQKQIDAFRIHTETRVPQGDMRYAPDRPASETQVELVVMVPQDVVADWYVEQPYLIDPIRDDWPFFWHFAPFREALAVWKKDADRLVDYEDGIGERVLVLLVGIALLLGGVLLLVPLVSSRTAWKEIPHKWSALVYFGAVGIGFMFVELPLIQQLSLLLGYPTRALSITLFGLLLSTGLGSFISDRYTRSTRKALGTLLAALFLLLALWHLAAPRAVHAFLGSSLALRAFVALLLITPIGVCLGGFLPLGLSVVSAASPHPRQFAAWAWAVSAFASVSGSALVVILAMLTGFKFVLVTAPVIYAAGAIALLRIEPRSPAAAQTS